MKPMKGDMVAKKRGMYPLIHVIPPEEVNDKTNSFLLAEAR
jgi:hypothetical protein